MNDTALLNLWEAALPLPALRRAQCLAQAAGAPPGATLGESNAALLRLRERLFGRRMQLRTACPHCAGELEFEIDTAALAAPGIAIDTGGQGSVHELTLGRERVQFRAPTAEDIAALGMQQPAPPDAQAWARALFERCVLQAQAGGQEATPAALSQELQAAVADRIDALEPLASLSFTLNCPDCDHGFDAALDLAGVTFAELRHRAEQVLADVAALASAYGWREADVLALSPMRRAAYLQLAGAAQAQMAEPVQPGAWS